MPVAAPATDAMEELRGTKRIRSHHHGRIPRIWAPEPRAVAKPSVRSPLARRGRRQRREILARGGSQPPFRTEPPPADFPAAPLVPRLEPDRVERVEGLSHPPGLHGESRRHALPTNPIEARIYFTHQARELGRLYHQRYNVELRTDLRSVELLQRCLAERFEDGVLETFDDVVEVRLHGAFLSELLARRLGAEWTDLAVSEMGYWSMNVPPGTTVWPIGRVIRFVTMQHRERDLVSYFLELQARAHGLK